jgi:hypothetical protein
MGIGRMFDWDRDCETETTRPRLAVGHPAIPQPPTETLRAPRPWRASVAGSLVVAVLLSTVWSLASARTDPQPMAVSLSAFGTPFVGVAEEPVPQMPVLRVYGARQVSAFQAGIARFPDPDLMLFAAQTEASLRDLADPGTSYLLDTRDLIAFEAARRGLAVRQASAGQSGS